MNCETKSQRNIVYKEWAYILVIPIVLTKILHPLMLKDGLDLSWWLVYFFLVYVVGAVITGWKTLKRISPPRTKTMSIVMWGIYYCFKFLVSLVIGIYLFPFRLIKQLYIVVKRKFF